MTKLRLLMIAVLPLSLVSMSIAQTETQSAKTRVERQPLPPDIDDVAVLQSMSRVLQRVSAACKPSVVHLEAKKTEVKRGRSEEYDEAGSGAIVTIDNRYYVITNRHVILGAAENEIDIRFNDGREINPVRIVSDASTDVAIMEIRDPDLQSAILGNSDEVAIGDFVLAIGSPFGLSHSVTFGIISAKGRRDLTLGQERIDLQDFFQTDAAINPGNSGGPLLNLRGEVIGLNTAIASSSGGSEGIGFAIPINMVMLVAKQLARNGELRRAYLGVSLEPNFTPQLAAQLGVGLPRGALVKAVTPNSPAARLLQRNDLIKSFNGIDIEDDDHLVNQVGLTPVGEEVPIVLIRDQTKYQTRITLTTRPTN